ncbi:hypothetical protein BIFCAT_00343 [Bifidobacterium catenulatum DSM 16992 = JCM 1194 = LMG 11043]|uniref:Uncharacterized protein n=1 Tax=Bifidobacterium catenulatum DSM 16992 = JCM 1194 = LMG 11043 TaxID=566552 RepID=B6XT33_9BIFI|nr:hypothetical protein BIFCAT_00343 [Bifidobacterium catenulatum DSM 16992 = JCM 1194 = LMG 11043]
MICLVTTHGSSIVFIDLLLIATVSASKAVLLRYPWDISLDASSELSYLTTIRYEKYKSSRFTCQEPQNFMARLT